MKEGYFCSSRITVLLGQNGTGKTSLIKLLAGKLNSDNGVTLPSLKVSYKAQHLTCKFQGTVRNFSDLQIKSAMASPDFIG